MQGLSALVVRNQRVLLRRYLTDRFDASHAAERHEVPQWFSIDRDCIFR